MSDIDEARKAVTITMADKRAPWHRLRSFLPFPSRQPSYFMIRFLVSFSFFSPLLLPVLPHEEALIPESITNQYQAAIAYTASSRLRVPHSRRGRPPGLASPQYSFPRRQKDGYLEILLDSFPCHSFVQFSFRLSQSRFLRDFHVVLLILYRQYVCKDRTGSMLSNTAIQSSGNHGINSYDQRQ